MVNETYIRLVDQTRVHRKNRNHFFAIAPPACVGAYLTTKTEHRKRRGGGAEHIALSDGSLISPERSNELLALDYALLKLEQQDERKSQVIEMRYFGGYSVKEVAKLPWRLQRNYKARLAFGLSLAQTQT